MPETYRLSQIRTRDGFINDRSAADREGMEEQAAADSLRVVVVDDSEVVRMKLRGLLSAAPDFELVGEAPDGETGLKVVQVHQPDLVVMDLKMPGISGIEATWQLGTLAPDARVLVLTVSAEQDDVTDAIMAGARGYVVKGAADEEIRAALRGVAAGERVISPQVAGKLAERTAPRSVEQEPPRAADAPLPLGWVLAIGLVGGVLVTLIGQGSEILEGAATTDTWVKAGLNVVIAVGIANLAALIVRLRD
jgi:DNA-binding NarL/FixJ family response regulator